MTGKQVNKPPLLDGCEPARLDNHGEARDESGLTQLLFDCKYHRSQELERVIALGANIHARDNQGRNAWFYVIHEKALECARVLAKHRVALEDYVDEGPKGRPIHYACRFQNREAFVHLLVDAGVDVNAAAAADGVRTALHWACENGDRPELIGTLVTAGAHINTLTHNKIAPLHTLASYGATQSAKVILEAGADPNIQSRNTPLFISVNWGYTNMTRLLLAYGAHPDGIGSNIDKTALQQACEDRAPELARMLLEAGANPYAETASWPSPLAIARQRRDTLSEVVTAYARGQTMDTDLSMAPAQPAGPQL